MANPIKYLLNVRTNRLFEGVADSDLKISVNQKDLINIPEGEIIYQTGDSSELIYLILDGIVKIKFNTAIDGQRIFEKMKDDFFGEREFIDNTIRASSAVANTNCSLLIVRRKDINDLVSRNRSVLGNLQGVSLSRSAAAPEPQEATYSSEIDNLLKTAGDYEDPFRKTGDSFQLTSDFRIPDFPEQDFKVPDFPANAGAPENKDSAEDSSFSPLSPEQSEPEMPADDEIFTGNQPKEDVFTPNKFSFTFSDDIYEQARKLATDEEAEIKPEVNLEDSQQDAFDPSAFSAEGATDFNFGDTEQTPVSGGEEKFSWDFSDEENEGFGPEEKVPQDMPAQPDTPSEPVSFNWKVIDGESEELNDTHSAQFGNVSESWNFSEKKEPGEGPEYEDDSFFMELGETENETELSDHFTPDTPAASWKESNMEIGNIRNTTLTPPPGEHFTPHPLDSINTTPAPKPEEVQHKFSAEQLRLLISAAEQINSNIKIDEVLKSIVQTASNLTGADRGTLYIVDSENGEIWSKVIRGENIEEIRLKIGQGLSGWVAQTADVVNVRDAHKDERFDPNMDKITGYVTRSVLCFPIINKANEVVAVLQLLNSAKGYFDVIDESFLSALSLLIAITLENAELVEQIVRTDRLTSLGKVANFIISDIKKPILTAKQLSEHLKKKTNLDNDVRQVVNLMSDQIAMVSDLIVTVLNYSQGKTILNKKIVSGVKILDEIIVLLGEFIGLRGIKVKKEYGPDALLNIDKKEIYQAILQIVKNACDAMPGGGKLIIRTTIDPENSNFVLSFTDTGLGVPGSLQEKIFEPFMCHGKKHGVGLGLPIAEKIIKEHGGKITLESEVGEGATFILSLPSVKGV